ncbi:plasminogen-binding N-terminal domain-containing protein [Nitratiruptor sp. YY09-18]|uniref:plasminogen-binding N-terminal domain-containing protein n=1 Tax=Nitratiruptor sp. YY09-18 TaxID=2724901 RepID=UPI00191559C6|nr:plasminogen-binding N-terminal domain-containing protein [Nitratiruptor sp. YY09-18]BCD67478.1 hypothetical protein NitYY0918_C0371 [Nitratiruptor sp. YY09-18]
MKKLVTLLLIVFTAFAATSTTITNAYKSKATIQRVNLPLGTSGIVIHDYDSMHSSIVARAILVAPDTIKFEVFDALAQEALPTPLTKPQTGDRVILGYLYDRATIIAPNLKSYQEVANQVDEKIIHPDLFATELSKAKDPAPDYNDFKNFCNKFALAKLYIVQKNQTDIVDCYSFKKIGTLPMRAEGKNVKLPFYNRLKKIQTSLFDFFGGSEIQNYFDYYKKLER